MNLILASSSPRRRDILSAADISFTVFTAPFDEASVSLAKPEEGVRKLALGKAGAAREKWIAEKGSLEEDTVFLGADTVVVLDGKAMGKPGSPEEAVSLLEGLSGKEHHVYTGVALLSKQKTDSFFVKTAVYFRQLSKQEIRDYVATGEPLDKAGAYGIQGKGRALVEKVDGDYLNVVGLPLKEVLDRLQKL